MKKLAVQFKALSDETRLKILSLLTKHELCVCEIIDELDMTQSAVSHHLKILKNAELVEDRREGKWIYYRLHDDNMQALGERFFEEFVHPAGNRGSIGNTRDIAGICEQITNKCKV